MASEFLVEVGRLLIEFQIWQLEQQKKEAGLDSPSPNADPTRPVRADHNGQQRHFTRKSGGGEIEN